MLTELEARGTLRSFLTAPPQCSSPSLHDRLREMSWNTASSPHPCEPTGYALADGYLVIVFSFLLSKWLNPGDRFSFGDRLGLQVTARGASMISRLAAKGKEAFWSERALCSQLALPHSREVSSKNFQSGILLKS